MTMEKQDVPVTRCRLLVLILQFIEIYAVAYDVQECIHC